MYSREQYEAAFALRAQGLSYERIAKSLGVQEARTVYGWIVIGQKPRGKFLKPTSYKLCPALAYVLATIAGDGHIKIGRTKGCLCLEVKDKDFAEYFREQLILWAGLTPSYYFNKRKGLYTVTLFSLRATTIVKNFDLNTIRHADNATKAHFLRGFFDAEGGVSGSNLDSPRKATRFIAAFNCRQDLIFFVRDLLIDLGIPVQNIDKRIGSGFSKDTVSYRLRVGSQDNLQAFRDKVGFSIARKNKLLDAVLASYRC